MAKNTANQNPGNKVARNSGWGPGGVDEIVPTREEARHGLERMQRPGARRGWMRPMGMGLGALALLGAGVAGLVVRQRRQKRSLRGRLEDMVGW